MKSSRYGWEFPVESVTTATAISLLTIVLGWRYIRNNGTRQSHWGMRFNLEQIAKDYPVFKLIRTSAVLFSSCYLLVCCTAIARWNAGEIIKVFSSAADKVGAYELAEVIYSYDPDPKPGLTLSSWKSQFELEDEDSRAGRSAAVEKIYGSHSLEMAERYQFIGANFAMGTGHDPKSMPLCFANYEKALELYRQHHAYRQCIDVIGQIATEKYDKTNSSGARKLLLEAAQLSSWPTESTHRNRSLFVCGWTFGLLEIISRQGGYTDLQEIFKSISEHDNLQLCDQICESDRVLAMIVIALLVTSVGISTGVGAPILLEICLVASKRRLLKLLTVTPSGSASINILDKLVTNGLRRGDLKQAQHDSFRLLKLAGCESTSSPFDCVDTRKKHWRNILTDQAHAAAFSLVFMSSYWL